MQDAISKIFISLLIVICSVMFNYISMTWVWGLEIKSITGFIVMTFVNGMFAHLAAATLRSFK